MFRLFFALFLLLFFRYAQGDVLTYLTGVAFGRAVEPYPWLCAIGATAVLVLLGRMGERWLSRRRRSTLPAYVVPAWLAAAWVSLPFASWAYQGVLLLAAAGLLLFFEWWERRLNRTWPAVRNLWQDFIPPAVRLLLLCLYVGLGAAATDVEHYELRTAEAIRTHHPKRAYRVGEKSLAVSPRLFALRCYLLATTHSRGLGDQLFKQPVPAGGSDNLFFPADEQQRLTLPVDSLYSLLGSRPHTGESRLQYLRRCARLAAFRQTTVERLSAPIDYYLCALLLDRRLDLFAREVKYFYPAKIARGKLPAYFAQALVYYNHVRTQPVVFYRDAAIAANYSDYTDMADTIAAPAARRNLLRRSYGETYWWWAEYGAPSVRP